MVSMSKLVSDFGTTLFPSLLFGWVPAHVAPFPPASARFAHSRALFSFDPSPRQQNTSSLVRQLRAKPEADREAKGEACLLAEPCADLAALPKGGTSRTVRRTVTAEPWTREAGSVGTGGRTTQLKETPLRLCVFAFFFLSPQTLGL